MIARFRVTYEIVTPESAEHGEAESMGFCAPGGWHFPASDPGPHDMTLREALGLCRPSEDSGRWWNEEAPGRTDWRTGAEEFRSIHPPRNITPASYARVSRLLGVRK